VTANLTLPVIVGGFELKLSATEVMGILIFLCVVVVFHIAVWFFIVSGHRKLWRTPRRFSVRFTRDSRFSARADVNGISAGGSPATAASAVEHSNPAPTSLPAVLGPA
jgi:hypothetical protein